MQYFGVLGLRILIATDLAFAINWSVVPGEIRHVYLVHLCSRTFPMLFVQADFEKTKVKKQSRRKPTSSVAENDQMGQQVRINKLSYQDM